MPSILVIHRKTGLPEEERIYGGRLLHLLYRASWPGRRFFQELTGKSMWLSKFYGWMQSKPLSRYKIRPFIRAFNVNEEEFAAPVESFRSFNDFFIRTLKPSARPIHAEQDSVVLPADGRFRVFPRIDQMHGLWIKGSHFDWQRLFMGNRKWLNRYTNGSIVVARLCPSDYHRFHFCADGVPAPAIAQDGHLFSVHPLAIEDRPSIFTENRRVYTELVTSCVGTVLTIEIGAKCVGSIHQTYTPETPVKKGDEKGYFSFGGSCILLCFEPAAIRFAQDLVEVSLAGLEMRAEMGQILGRPW